MTDCVGLCACQHADLCSCTIGTCMLRRYTANWVDTESLHGVPVYDATPLSTINSWNEPAHPPAYLSCVPGIPVYHPASLSPNQHAYTSPYATHCYLTSSHAPAGAYAPASYMPIPPHALPTPPAGALADDGTPSLPSAASQQACWRPPTPINGTADELAPRKPAAAQPPHLPLIAAEADSICDFYTARSGALGAFRSDSANPCESREQPFEEAQRTPSRCEPPRCTAAVSPCTLSRRDAQTGMTSAMEIHGTKRLSAAGARSKSAELSSSPASVAHSDASFSGLSDAASISSVPASPEATPTQARSAYSCNLWLYEHALCHLSRAFDRVQNMRWLHAFDGACRRCSSLRRSPAMCSIKLSKSRQSLQSRPVPSARQLRHRSLQHRRRPHRRALLLRHHAAQLQTACEHWHPAPEAGLAALGACLI